MPSFQYTATTATGEKKTGTIDAPDRKQALQRLQGERLRVTDLRHGHAGDDVAAQAARVDSTDKLALASEQLDKIGPSAGAKLACAFFAKVLQLHGSGMPLGDAVRLLSSRTSDPLLTVLTSRLWRDLSEGRSLAAALALYPRIFDPAMIHLVEAGETTGNLCPVLQNLITSLEESASLRRRILGGLAYPGFVCCIAFGVVCLFIFFLLPRIQGMMQSMGQQMSLSARILIGFSDAFLHWGPFVAAGLVIAAMSIRRWRKTEEGRRKTDEMLLKLPVIGGICVHTDACRISNLLGTLIESGVNTTEALRMTEKAVQNTVTRERFAAARVMINDGAAFSLALRKHAVLPDLDLDILSVGEGTGSLVRSFHEIHKNHSAELNAQFKMLTSVISTVALLGAFTLVGLLAIGIVSSVLSLSQGILGR